MILRLQSEGRVKWKNKKDQQKQMDPYVQRRRFKYGHAACREVQVSMVDLEIWMELGSCKHILECLFSL